MGAWVMLLPEHVRYVRAPTPLQVLQSRVCMIAWNFDTLERFVDSLGIDSLT
jgi:hypothetical protein